MVVTCTDRHRFSFKRFIKAKIMNGSSTLLFNWGHLHVCTYVECVTSVLQKPSITQVNLKRLWTELPRVTKNILLSQMSLDVAKLDIYWMLCFCFSGLCALLLQLNMNHVQWIFFSQWQQHRVMGWKNTFNLYFNQKECACDKAELLGLAASVLWC